MENSVLIRPIARIYTDFTSKFGIPRQSGMVKELTGRIVFEPEFRSTEAVRELDSFSHLWLIWQFSESVNEQWHATVRPPRLGGNRRVGVFASRSPFRPNNLALSCVKLERIDFDCPNMPELVVSGIDILNGTPIFDIKPYLPYADCLPEATDGYTATTKNYALEVDFPEELLPLVPEASRAGLLGVLSGDPRPGYAESSDKEYGLAFAGLDVGFRVRDGVLHVTRVRKI